MIPNRDQIEVVAYDRWLRRDRAHGFDRHDWISAENELKFSLNYQTIVEYPLDSSSPLIPGGDSPRRCRFCERTLGRASSSSTPRPVIQFPAETTLLSAQACDECQEECRGPLAAHCEIFWRALTLSEDVQPSLPSRVDALAVFKSMVASALLIMPESELAYFTDTMEWVNNPDGDHDRALFAGAYCHVYRAPFLREKSWVSLTRRIDDDAPYPYMIFFVACEGIVLQMSLPMCVRDDDLDGRAAPMPARSFTAGTGYQYHEATFSVLRLAPLPRERPRRLPALLGG